LIKEVSTGPAKRDVTSFVEHYGKETKGFLSYSEFREIYLIHVHQTMLSEEGMKSSVVDKSSSSANTVEEGKLRALFGIFDY
jgi:hypothetical protein